MQDAQHWDADSYTVKSGATVTLRDKSTENQPHTLSLVKKLPKTPAQIMGCDACGPLMAAHEANMETGEVGKALVEAGADGFDTGGDKTAAGDSIYLPPKGKVTLQGRPPPKGTTLNFICAVHPWMLGHDQGQVGRRGAGDVRRHRARSVRRGGVVDALRDAAQVRAEHHVRAGCRSRRSSPSTRFPPTIQPPPLEPPVMSQPMPIVAGLAAVVARLQRRVARPQPLAGERRRGRIAVGHVVLRAVVVER